MEAGKCAKCDSENIVYGNDYLNDDTYIFEYKCHDCKAEGKEIYYLDFITNELE